ncbi:alpha/beta fold hydrolase [Synechococcus sp. UW179A]|uniref:alpha/beta fold hydrolase n=1 Tax=Synechococcus sp. UW179A TaxID=2575510 RepID=UPI000E0E3B33|nr:alpha/beta hydrolase [Synechococcus sp. UW179A]
MTLHNSKLLAVLLPGFGCDLDSMLELNLALNEYPKLSRTKCDIFTLETSLEEMTSKVVKQYSDSDLLLVGFSMGGWVAQEVASRIGSQVKGLVLISSWSEAPPQYLEVIHTLYKDLKSGRTLCSLRSMVAEGFTNKQKRDVMTNRWMAMANRIGHETFLRQIKAILDNPNVHKNIRNIQCPIFAIAGAEDRLIKPYEQFKHLQEQTQCQTTILESCGHNLIWEKPQATSEIVKQWLDSNLS